MLTFFVASAVFAQSEPKTNFSSWDVAYLNGTILEHNPDIGHLIQERTTGLRLRYNRKTTGEKEWQQRYNYPDWGVTAFYQDMGNPELGKNYSLLGHFNFYFLNRNLVASMGGGIAYNTNPYDAETNFRNVAYGSHLMSAITGSLTYRKERLLGNFGVEAGVYLAHYSNGKLRAPNTSTNVLSFGLGINYSDRETNYVPQMVTLGSYEEPWHFSVQLHGGANETSVIGRGRNPLFGLQVYADKRWSYKSVFQVGAEWFWSQSIKEFVRYRSVAFPEDGLTGDESASRIGLFVGYELRISQVAAFVQAGYYVYYPVPFENRFYNRLGLKRYFGDHIYGSIAVKAHAAKAEAIEFGIGYRL
ncbi:acyloxyacyl hydrolase [Dokdonia sinensis]|uniref:acyloxyacyl hydrolase n=1 Tax=Dokdonia sinensis TaxID=2479847 RepID=UPI001F27961F|nr:acyloxyacyl hydrolase [Dokdonia sinensis]